MATPAQPLHPEIIPRLDPEYVEFHNAHIANIIPPHTLPWQASLRNASIPGGSEPLDVGNIRDISLSHCKCRVFTPKGSPPAQGWPVFIFFHGGGWTLGNINSENSFSTRMCNGAQCVVVSVDYRLAPEEPYPTAVQDAVEALEYVHTKGKIEFHVNTEQIAIGGSSSGGNLAAVLAVKAASTLQIPIIFQLLIVPVTDNTSSGETYLSWRENEHTAWLSPARMLWFRNNYVPNVADRIHPDNSPIFSSPELLAKVPSAWIGVTELDILRDEGLVYGEKLKAAGVTVETKVYLKAPHPIMAMDSALVIGKQLVHDAAQVLARAFSSSTSIHQK